MDRRAFITAVTGSILVAPLVGEAQHPDKVARVGVLWPGPSVPTSPRMESLRQGLRESGYIEGQNVAIDANALMTNFHLLRMPTLRFGKYFLKSRGPTR